MNEVRFDYMVPSAVVARRQACNLAYLPVGSLEWHGSHMPFGTDYFTVNYLAIESAQRFGGVAFPPIYYGDVRYILQENRVEWRKTYTREMAVPEAHASAFPLQNADGTPGAECPTQPDDGPAAAEPLAFSREGQEREFARQIAMIMVSIHLYGFRHIMLLPGHGPNPAYCKNAESIYRENILRRSGFGEPARTMTWFYINAADDVIAQSSKHWLHADKWEGSVTMVAAPGTVHLNLLPDDPKAIPPAYLGAPFLTEDGYNPERKADWPAYDDFDPRNGTSEAYGREQTEEILGKFEMIVREFLRGEAP